MFMPGVTGFKCLMIDFDVDRTVQMLRGKSYNPRRKRFAGDTEGFVYYDWEYEQLSVLSNFFWYRSNQGTYDDPEGADEETLERSVRALSNCLSTFASDILNGLPVYKKNGDSIVLASSENRHLRFLKEQEEQDSVWRDDYSTTPKWAIELWVHREHLLAYYALSAADVSYPILRSEDEVRQFKTTHARLVESCLGQVYGTATDKALSLPPKLEAALAAFSAVAKSNNAGVGKSVKQQLTQWLKQNRPTLTETGIEEIAKVANWETSGGAPKSGGQLR